MFPIFLLLLFTINASRQVLIPHQHPTPLLTAPSKAPIAPLPGPVAWAVLMYIKVPRGWRKGQSFPAWQAVRASSWDVAHMGSSASGYVYSMQYKQSSPGSIMLRRNALMSLCGDKYQVYVLPDPGLLCPYTSCDQRCLSLASEASGLILCMDFGAAGESQGCAWGSKPPGMVGWDLPQPCKLVSWVPG